MKEDRTIRDIKINKVSGEYHGDRINDKNNNNSSENHFNRYNNSYNGDNKYNRVSDIDDSSQNMYRINKIKNKKSIKNKILMWLAIIIGIFFVINYLFHSSEINIIPKTTEIELKDTVFSVNKFEGEDKKTVGEFYYKIKKNEIIEKEIPLKISAYQEVKEKANGKISIKNDTEDTVSLVKRTRFKLNDKIYRIQNTINIPKKSSKEVTVVADNVGEEYNNLKKGEKYLIPGFLESKNENYYKNVYGISTTIMKGGYSGEKPVPDKEDLKEKKAKLIKEIELKIKDVTSQETKKTNDLYFRNIAKKNIEDEDIIKGDKLFLKVKASLIIPYIEKSNFDSVIINKAVESKVPVEGYLKKGGDFKYSFINTENLDYVSGDSFKIKITGHKTVVWDLDSKQIRKRAVNEYKSEFIKEIKESFPVENVDVSIFPFWKNTLPGSIDKIKVNIEE